MPLHSAPENMHFGASFMFVGGVEAEISMSLNRTFSRSCQRPRTSISRLLHPLKQTVSVCYRPSTHIHVLRVCDKFGLATSVVSAARRRWAISLKNLFSRVTASFRFALPNGQPFNVDDCVQRIR